MSAPRLVMLALLAALATGCAPVGGGPKPATAPPAAGTSSTTQGSSSAPVAPPPAPAAAPAALLAPADRAPSADALAVLETIPEPLKPGERVPPPSLTHADSVAAAAALDSASTLPDSVPTPELTKVLGDSPGGAASAALEDSLLRAAAAPVVGAAGAGAAAGSASGAAPPAAAVSAPAAATAAPDTCWRVQFAAPAEKAQAESMRRAAESQLSVPVVIEPEKGLFKVRTRDCVGRTVADRLKQRAALAGFDGVFLTTSKPK